MKKYAAVLFCALILLATAGCSDDYPFMVIGFPVDKAGVPIIDSSGKKVDYLTKPWIFTLDQVRSDPLPLSYRDTAHKDNPIFVKAKDISFAPPEIQKDAWQPFSLNTEQLEMEGAKWKWDGQIAQFSIAFDMGPWFHFSYRVKQGLIEPIEGKRVGGCFLTVLDQK